MKLLLAYLVGIFGLGLLARVRRGLAFILLLGACLFVCFAYFFLNQI